MDDPRCKKSITERVAPKRAKDRIDIAAPRFV
jgi:hypothetical protein